MRYRIKMINTETNEKQLTMMGFTSKKEAIEWADEWKALGKPHDCEVIDTKNGMKKVY